MTRSSHKVALATLLVVGILLLAAAPAFAFSASERQTDPGVTVRTIWDRSQSAVYKLPTGVNHRGNIHMEVTFRPMWADIDIYLLDQYGATLSEEMGYMGAFLGREVIDYKYMNVTNQTIVDPDAVPDSGDEYMEGDPVYVAIVAFNEPAKYQIRGYYPQIDLSVSSNTTNQWNYGLRAFKAPQPQTDWARIKGPIYGYPYDFKPTSEGDVTVNLQWPASVADKTVTPYSADIRYAANLESYVYAGGAWDTIWEDYGDSNWDLGSVANTHTDGATTWHGLQDSATLDESIEGFEPGRMLHFIPDVYLVSEDWARNPATTDPTLGQAPAKIGTTWMGYKATVMYPQNLRITSATRRVAAGGKATIKGTFALTGAWKAGEVSIQKKTSGGGWATVKKVMSGADGKWTAKVNVTRTTIFRAKAAGEAPGLAEEKSLNRTVRVH